MAGVEAAATAAQGSKMLVIGVGGATSSGKTTLAKHLCSILQRRRQPQQQQEEQPPVSGGRSGLSAVILHQDDFALPEEQLPWNETLQARDWDHPVGTIDYRRLKATLQHAKMHGSLPEHHSSHDHLNEQPERPVLSPQRVDDWHARLTSALERAGIQGVVLADGFLLYYDAGVRHQMDVRLLLRCTRKTLEARREARGGYATAEGTVWQDPPGYFEHVIWPAYVLAHRALFANGDVEQGEPAHVDKDAEGDGQAVCDLVLLNSDNETSMEAVVDAACAAIERQLMAEPAGERGAN